MLLPGEAISKYRGITQSAPLVVEEPTHAADAEALQQTYEPAQALGESFPQDEPLFAEAIATISELPAADFHPQEVTETKTEIAQSEVEAASDRWDREQKRLHQMNEEATFGGSGAEEGTHEETETDADSRGEVRGKRI